MQVSTLCWEFPSTDALASPLESHCKASAERGGRSGVLETEQADGRGEKERETRPFVASRGGLERACRCRTRRGESVRDSGGVRACLCACGSEVFSLPCVSEPKSVCEREGERHADTTGQRRKACAGYVQAASICLISLHGVRRVCSFDRVWVRCSLPRSARALFCLVVSV